MKLIIVLGVILFLGIPHSNCRRYDNYKLFRVTFSGDQQDLLRKIVSEVEGADYWLFSIADGIADIFTSPQAEAPLLNLLAQNRFAFRLVNTNVQSMIDGVKVA